VLLYALLCLLITLVRTLFAGPKKTAGDLLENLLGLFHRGTRSLPLVLTPVLPLLPCGFYKFKTAGTPFLRAGCFFSVTE